MSLAARKFQLHQRHGYCSPLTVRVFWAIKQARTKISLMKESTSVIHGGESRDLNDKVHGILCWYSDETSKQTYHIFRNTQPIFIKQSANTS